jgi:UPF0271 protein
VLSVDLNSDLGEGLPASHEEAILAWVTSANVACGAHAGDAATMAATTRRALARGVAVGAHPGYPDRECFGRRPLDLSAGELGELVRAQVETLAALVDDEGGRLSHVKPHGALYQRAAREAAAAEAVARAVHAVDPGLVLFAPPGSELLAAGGALGLALAAEAFADRAYMADGSLAPRHLPGAVISDVQRAAEQALGLVLQHKVVALDGTELELRPDTICIHGDEPGAPELARAVRARLEAAGVRLASPR